MDSLRTYYWPKGPDRMHVLHLCKAESRFGPHIHSGFYELVLVLKGVLHHELNGECFDQYRGGVVLLRPQDTHAVTHKACDFYMVSFSDAYAENAFAHLLNEDILWQMLNAASPMVAELPEADLPLYELQAEHLLLAQGTPSESILFHHFLFSLLARAFLRSCSASSPGHLPSWLQDVLDYLDRRTDLNPDVPMLSRLCGCSPEHTARTFRRYLNKTPSTYLNERRLRQAERMLLGSEPEIIDLAFEAGFNNLNYFYRLFQKQYGTSPKRYRDRHRGGPAGRSGIRQGLAQPARVEDRSRQ